jgi:1-acyl-sn-glycerol-3-phosphate acyltransferase
MASLSQKIIIVVMNLTVFPLLVIMTIIGMIISPFGFLIFKIFSRLNIAQIMRFLVGIYGRGWLIIIRPWIRLQKTGLKKGDIPSPCIIVPNHLSFFDTFFMGALPYSNSSNMCIAIRSWPFKMLWYRPFMELARYLDVENTELEDILESCKKELANGATLLFFPEAHRSRDGKLGRFYSGAFKVSVATGVPIVPLCIAGTDEMYPPGRWFLKPAEVQLTALPAVFPAGFPGPQGHMAMRKFVKALMAEQIEKMR